MSHFSDLPPVEYEKHDVSTGSVSRTSALIVAMTIFSMAVAWGYLRWLHRADQKTRQASAPAVVHPPERVPPEPRLQRAPFDDVRSLQEQERELLGSYGFVDAQAGLTRIPIEEAMRIYVERAAANRAAHPFDAAAAPQAPARPAGAQQ